MTAHVIGLLIARLDELKAIHMRASRLAALQEFYRAAIPEELARRSRVADERSGTLVVAADTSAVAAKLRQLVPRIVSETVKNEPEVTAIRVEVQVGEPARPVPRTPRPHIAPQGLESFAHLRDALSESPLRQALSRLMEHAKHSHGQDDALQNEDGEHDQR